MLRSFHVSLHARPVHVQPGPLWESRGARWPTVRLAAEEVRQAFPVQGEAAAEELGSLPRMFLEPDGSFVWVSAAEETPWQLDGQLYESHDRLLYVDLKGSCPVTAFDAILRACGWPTAQVVVQDMRAGVFLEDADFRQFAEN